jgi:glycosyltransferase involved in cell wall biosynthesis
MKLAFVGNGLLDTDCYPTPNQGGSVQTWGLARELARRGHDVSIIRRSNFEKNETIERVNLVSITFKGPENIVPLPFMSFPFFAARLLSGLYFSKRCKEMLLKNRPDVVLFLDMFSGIFSSNLPTQKIYIMHVSDGLDFIKPYSVSANRLNVVLLYIKKKIQDTIMLRASKIVALSSFIEMRLKYCGFNNVVRIPNGINAEGFRNGGDENYILYAGRFDWNKNACELVRAFAELKDIYPGYKLHLVGAGPEEQRIKQLIIKKNLQSRVFLFPWLPRKKLLDMMSNCSIFVLPSFFEAANPVVILEAMALSKPVISKRNIGTKDIIDHCKNGYLYDNEKELCTFLEILLSDSGIRQKIGQNGRKTVEETYDFRQIANEYEKTFLGLLK